MKMPHIRSTLAAMIAVAGVVVAHASNFTITSSTSGSSARFIVTRDDTTAAETVNYRTVSISAYAGQHYTAKSGTLTFPAGQSAVTNTVTETTPTAAAYRFQTGTSRYYRFELTDAGGFLVTNATRTLTTGTRVTASDAFGVKNLTIQSSEYTADDRGYDSNGYKSVSSNGYFAAAAPKAYFQLVDAQLRMTLSMDAKENDDAYEYLQLLFNNTSTCDNRSGASNGDPGTPSLSSYMAGFEMDTGSKDDTYRTYTFPVTNVANNAGATNPWGYSSNGKYPLSKQKFNTTTSSRAADGRIVVPLNFTNIVLRLNASGKSGSDQWAAKSVIAHVQAVDTNAPTKIAASAAPGIHARGNAIYVSVAFSEPVTGTPSLTTSWGTLNYFSGSGSNVLTFKGTIPSTATGSLNVTGKSGTISDLAGNPIGATDLAQKNLATLDTSHTYAIAYDLAGGTLPSGRSNPYTYIYEDQRILLANPLRPGYVFDGWTGTGISGLTNAVNIYQSHGDRAYVANWTPITYFVHFDPGAADATGPMPDQTLTYDAPQALSSNAFTRAGYTFTGWRGADGAIYPDRATVLNLTNAQDAVVSLTATWRPNIPYIDEDGTERLCTDYTVLTDATSGVTYGEFGATAWYVVTNAVTISGQLGFRDTSHLILCDGATLAVTNANGYAIDANDLTIYGQTNGSGTVTATATGGDGIYAGYVTINGGTVTATATGYGIYAVYGSVTINGGTVTATGSSCGIWAADAVTINGGTVTATGICAVYGYVTINGGTVTAEGGTGISAYHDVEINGGTVTAEGDNCGIYAASVTINGGTVTAEGGTGIYADGGSVTINGGTVTATGESYGIYADGGSVTINGGTVTATGGGTGGTGIYADGGFITLGWTNPTDSITASSYLGPVDLRQTLTDGSAIYKGDLGFSPSALAGKTLVPAYSITLPEGVVASGVVTQDVNTAYALPGTNVTLSVVTPGYAIGTVTVNDVPLADGTCSFAASADAVTIAVTMTPITYTVRFDAGGGEGPMPDQSFTYDTPQAIASNAFTRANHAFTGWRGADGSIYADGATVLNLTNAQDAVVSLVAQWGIPYIDADGTERICTDYTVLTNATGDVEYGEWNEENWYVVTNSVTISGLLRFNDTAHLILCDGATLAVTNANGSAIQADGLFIYGQTNGTGSVTASGTNGSGICANYAVTINGGTVTAEGDDCGIFAAVSVTINGGTVTANGGEYGDGIRAGSIILGWTNPTDSITASSYFGNVNVKNGQPLTDGSAIYKGAVDPVKIAGKTLRPHFVPYIDADGVERFCTDFTVLTNAVGNATYGTNGATAWYVVTNAVTISGQLFFGDDTAHLILCDGASLAVTNEGGVAIEASSLTIYGQTNGTGTVTATCDSEAGIYAYNGSVTINGGNVTATGNRFGIWAPGDVTINGGTVTATCHGEAGIYAQNYVTINGGTVTAEGGNNGIFANGGSIILGWTNPTDSITASSYYGPVSVKFRQRLTDGSNIYLSDLAPYAIDGKTLRPAYSITLPEGVVASGVVTQIVNTAYARPGDTVTLSAAPGVSIRDVTVNGDALEPVGGIYSFAASAASITVAAAVGIPYIDADGVERLCADFTVLTNAEGDVEYGGGSGWYVATNAVTISGQLFFGDTSAHLILCDGATLVVTNEGGIAIEAGDLIIYGQTNGTGTVTAKGGDCGIYTDSSVTINGGTVTAESGPGGTGIYVTRGDVTINGGTVTANGGSGIRANGGDVTINGGTVTANGGSFGIFADHAVTINGGTVTANATGANCWGIRASIEITLGWTNPTDSITASSYRGAVNVKNGQRLTDGSAIYEEGIDASALAGVTLRPYIDTPTYPAYLGLPADPDDDTDEDFDIRANYDAWAQRYGYDAFGANETAYLLDVAPWAVTNGVAPLKVAEMGVTNILVGEAGDFGWVAQRMGYTGGTLPIWRLVLASDVAPLKEGFYDALTVCNGYLVLRIGTDLSVPKSEWLETGWFARVEDGRAEKFGIDGAGIVRRDPGEIFAVCEVGVLRVPDREIRRRVHDEEK